VKNYIITEKVICNRYYLVQSTTKTSAINQAKELSDDCVELNSWVEYSDKPNWSADELTEEEKEDFTVQQALKSFISTEEPTKKKRRRRTKAQMLEARKNGEV